jgi:hypothetical protein
MTFFPPRVGNGARRSLRFPPLEMCVFQIDLIRDLHPKVKDFAACPIYTSADHKTGFLRRSAHLYQRQV